jgi:hypothetical protein
MRLGWFPRQRTDDTPTRQSASTQQAKLFLDSIEEGVIDLGGGEYRSVLEVAARNLDLASPEERDEVVATFQAFLNGLTFPVQILVRIERLGAEDYLTRLDQRARREVSEPLRELALAQLGFVRDLAASQVLLHRRFLLVVPFSLPSAIDGAGPGWLGLFRRAPRTAQASGFARRLLTRRRVELIRELATVGLGARALGTDEVLALYYQALCPTLARLQPLRQTLAAATTPAVRGPRALSVPESEEV